MGAAHLLFGRNLFEEALLQKVKIKEIFVEHESARRWVDELLRKHKLKLAIKSQLPSAVKAQSHQGVAFSCEHDFYLSPKAVDLSRYRRILLCNHIVDVQNLGTLVRSAVAFGVELVVHEDKRSAELTPAAIKASAGQAFRIPFLRVSSLGSLISEIKGQGFELLALSASKDSSSIYSWTPKGPWAVVIGSEGSGVQPAILHEADAILEIPMKKSVESLNAAQAASIFMSWAHSQEDSR